MVRKGCNDREDEGLIDGFLVLLFLVFFLMWCYFSQGIFIHIYIFVPAYSRKRVRVEFGISPLGVIPKL